jgi:hypothetical protein
MLKSRNQITPVMQPIVTGTNSFDSYDPTNIDEIPLLFQTGYLTVKQRTLIGSVAEYTLGFPNLEVRDAIC